MSEIYTETIFGKVLNGHPVIYKGNNIHPHCSKGETYASTETLPANRKAVQ